MTIIQFVYQLRGCFCDQQSATCKSCPLLFTCFPPSQFVYNLWPAIVNFHSVTHFHNPYLSGAWMALRPFRARNLHHQQLDSVIKRLFSQPDQSPRSESVLFDAQPLTLISVTNKSGQR